MTLSVNHETAANRFTAQSEGHLAELVYRLDEGKLVIEHTAVPGAIGGRGIAGALVKAALDHARASGLRVVPACSYSAEYIRRHPDYADLVDASGI
ncbi:MAG: GNAT family N-acetyltransferase [Pseudoxanthomonas sp.]